MYNADCSVLMETAHSVCRQDGQLYFCVFLYNDHQSPSLRIRKHRRQERHIFLSDLRKVLSFRFTYPKQSSALRSSNGSSTSPFLTAGTGHYKDISGDPLKMLFPDVKYPVPEHNLVHRSSMAADQPLVGFQSTQINLHRTIQHKRICFAHMKRH